MSNSNENIDSLVREVVQKVDTTESVDFNLGRPEIVAIPEMDHLASEGNKVIPTILPFLNEGQPKRAAYLVHAMSQIPENEQARTKVEALREKILKKPSKTEWDYAAIGECNLMLGSK